MPLGSYANRMRGDLRRIIDAENTVDPEGAAKRHMVYTLIIQHAEKSSPIDDNWITQEVVKEATGIISVEIVKGTHASDAFISHVTDRKYPLLADETLYVVHVENMPYESYEGDDNGRINQAHHWLKETLVSLQQKYGARYVVVCSPFADSLFEPSDTYPLRQEFQENTRMYRTLLASRELFAQEEEQLQLQVASLSDGAEKSRYENQLKRYQHYKTLLAKKDAIKLGMKKVDDFIAS